MAAIKSEGDNFDPFEERRRVEKYLETGLETFAHIMKCAVGTGILGMPIAFKYTGYVLGLVSVILTGIICCHGSAIVIRCAHKLYYKMKIIKMNYGEVVVGCFANGPQWAQKFATPMKYITIVFIFLAYFGSGCVYSIIVATNIKKVIDYYRADALNLRLFMVMLMIAFVLIAWVPNYKYLAKFSMVANLFMLAGVGITMYYAAKDISDIKDRTLIQFKGLPGFLAIAIFAMQCIGVIMPLENVMKNPEKLIGGLGIWHIGMIIITIIYAALGLLGYFCYGENTEGNITVNLPDKSIAAQAVQIMIALAVFCTFGITMLILLEIIWLPIKDKLSKLSWIVNYIVRTLLAVSVVSVGIAMPTIAPFMGLVGALCLASLALIIPAIIDTMIRWNEGFGRFKWIAVKNFLLALFGILALIFGSISSICEIISLYTGEIHCEF